MEDYKALFNSILNTSEFLKTVVNINKKKTKSRIYGNKVRPLKAVEIKKLKAHGNYSDDWKKILVSEKFRTENISGNQFIGKCVFGHFDGKEIKADASLSLPSGIYNSTIKNSEIGDNCSIWSAGCISNYIIGKGAVVFEAGSLTCSENTSFGNGREISIGIETGGREVLSFAEMTIPIAHAVSTKRNSPLIGEYKDFIKSYMALCKSGVGIVENGCRILRMPKIEDSFIGEASVVDSVSLIQNSTILGSPDEPVEISHGAFVKNSCLQWGSHVTSMAIVDDSVLTEHSHVERHGKVTQSIIGPNTGVAEGEVTACLVGPFVGFHHQALLIAAVWPEGKGNVGYGANIGSNHTSKAPDQEIWCGEGTFFGLAVNIKFPCDFSNAPYSIIATAVTTLPQSVEFPFSLINHPSVHINGISPAYNEITPGWVLSDNIYTVKRNEGKYKKRNKARRTVFVFDVFRPDIIDMMIKARKRLNEPAERKDIYTASDIPGLGKNYMTEHSRIKGISAYDFYIEYYCLSGLKQRVDILFKEGVKDIHDSVYSSTKDDVWEHQRNIMINNGFNTRTVKENLMRLKDMEEQIANATQKAKEKDDVRGAGIIADYSSAHSPASEDSFAKETWARVAQVKAEIDALLNSRDLQ